MARHIFAACGALAIAGVALSAQSTSSPSSSPTAQTPNPAGTITVQGCLKPASASPSGAATGTTGTSGTTGAAAGGAEFRLTDAKASSGAPGATGGATGTTGGAAASASDEYQLRAESASVNLSQHLNHQIEVTGRVASSSSSAPAAGTTGAGATGAGAMGSKPILTVTAVKMIAAECK